MKIKSRLLDNNIDSQPKKKKSKSPKFAPIQKVKELTENRSPKGINEVVIGGIPVDVFDIEDMVIKVSPSDMKTVLRYDNARVIEHMRNTQRPKLDSVLEGKGGLFILLLIVAGGFLVLALFGGDILAMLKNFLPT